MRKILYILITISLLLSNFTIANATGFFTDIDGHWAEKNINYLSGIGKIEGYSDRTFRPDEFITVQSFAKMLINALNYEIKSPSINWEKKFIDKAISEGYIKEGEFDDFARPLKRYEMVFMAVRGVKKDFNADLDLYLSQIKDYDQIPNNYREDVLKAYSKGLIKGENGQNFDSNYLCTRAQAATIIARLIWINQGIYLSAIVPDVAKPQDITKGNSNYYVALNGSDLNDGSIEKPFATLEKARDTIRKLKKQGSLPKGEITVYLREGEYFRNSSFTLTQEDKGTIDNKIVYSAFPKETVRISGGIKLEKEKFKPIASQEVSASIIDKTARKVILQIDLKAEGILDYGHLSRHGFHKANMGELPPVELFVNKKQMQLSRWPNDSTVSMSSIIEKGPVLDWQDSEMTGEKNKDWLSRGGIFSYTEDRYNLWKNTDDIWLAGVFANSWEWSYNKIKNIDKTNKQIELAYGEVGGLEKLWFPDFHHYENILEEIDIPNEYYIDRKNGILYYYPNDDFNSGTGDIMLSMIDKPLFDMRGADYVTIKNIKFDSGRNVAISSLGSDYQPKTIVPQGNLHDGIPENDKGSKSVIIDNCEIYNFTTGGVIMSGTDNYLMNSHLHNLGGNGIIIQGGEFETLTPSDNYVRNNKIHDVSYYHQVYTPAIFARGVGSVIEHNEIFNAPHSAIMFLGNDHIIQYNEIYSSAYAFSDMGVIYTNTEGKPWYRNFIIRRNYFHDIAPKEEGVQVIYVDFGGVGTTIEENIFYKIGRTGSNQVNAVCGIGSYFKIKNNVFVENSGLFWHGSKLDPSYKQDPEIPGTDAAKFIDTFKKYNFFKDMPHSKKYPELMRWFDENPYNMKTNIFSGNLIVNINTELTSNNSQGYLGHLELTTTENNWIVKSDPGFVDFKNGNLNLKEDSPVYKKIPGFPVLSTEEMGLIKTKGE